MNLQMFKLDLEKAEEPEIKVSLSITENPRFRGFLKSH